MAKKQHRLPLGTKVSFEGDSFVYETADYQTLLDCEAECHDDHDCYPEPYVCVSRTITTAMPLSKLKTIFDEKGFGRDPTPEEREFDEEGT